MRKSLLGLCVAIFIWGIGIETQNVFAQDDGFISSQEAMRIGANFVNDFNQIVIDGVVEQYHGTWAYDALVDWQKVMDEIGTYIGIKSNSAMIDAEKAVINIVAHGTKRYAVIEFVLYFEDVPQINVYSKFSLTKWLVDTGVGAILLILNTVFMVVLFVLYLKKPKTLPISEREQSIDDTIANIIKKEEKKENEEAGADTSVDVEVTADEAEAGEVETDEAEADEAEAGEAETDESKEEDT